MFIPKSVRITEKRVKAIITCVFNFSLQLLFERLSAPIIHNNLHSRCSLVFLISVFHFCPIFTKIGISWQFLTNLLNMKFNANHLSVSWIVKCKWTHRQGKDNTYIFKLSLQTYHMQKTAFLTNSNLIICHLSLQYLGIMLHFILYEQ